MIPDFSEPLPRINLQEEQDINDAIQISKFEVEGGVGKAQDGKQ